MDDALDLAGARVASLFRHGEGAPQPAVERLVLGAACPGREDNVDELADGVALVAEPRRAVTPGEQPIDFVEQFWGAGRLGIQMILAL